MLSEAKMVARKFLEKNYNCTCNIIERQEVVKENKSTIFQEVTVFENQPCKISYVRINKTESNGNANIFTLTPKLFISPDLKIKPGSMIIVTDSLNNILKLKSSGFPAVYETHQEIMLELFDRWS